MYEQNDMVFRLEPVKYYYIAKSHPFMEEQGGRNCVCSTYKVDRRTENITERRPSVHRGINISLWLLCIEVRTDV